MRSIKFITTGFVLTTALIASGCKSDSGESVVSAREKVTEREDKVVAQQRDLSEAKTDLQQARADFVKAVNERLAEIDRRIDANRANAAVDQQRLQQLRAEAAALVAQAADTTRPFVPEAQVTSDRIFRDLDVELNRGATGAGTGSGMGTADATR